MTYNTIRGPSAIHHHAVCHLSKMTILLCMERRVLFPKDTYSSQWQWLVHRTYHHHHHHSLIIYKCRITNRLALESLSPIRFPPTLRLPKSAYRLRIPIVHWFYALMVQATSKQANIPFPPSVSSSKTCVRFDSDVRRPFVLRLSQHK